MGVLNEKRCKNNIFSQFAYPYKESHMDELEQEEYND